jgi:hypothetical protein
MEDKIEVKLETITRQVELKQVLSDVEYSYANHAALASSKWDIRIAFGDITPDGKVTPSRGVIIPFLVAKNLARALQRMVDSVEESIGEIVDPDHRSRDKDG